MQIMPVIFIRNDKPEVAEEASPSELRSVLGMMFGLRHKAKTF